MKFLTSPAPPPAYWSTKTRLKACKAGLNFLSALAKTGSAVFFAQRFPAGDVRATIGMQGIFRWYASAVIRCTRCINSIVK